MTDLNVKSRTLMLAKMALMVAISFICTFIHFPILPMAPFLEFEVSDIPILIAGFAFGPLPGFVIGVVSIMLRALILSPPSGPYGLLMHVIAISVFVVIASLIYKRFKTKKWGLFSLIIGGLCMTAVMIPANLLITPHFMGVPLPVVQAMILPVLLPFNLLKAAINTAVVFLLYKRLSPFLHKWGNGKVPPPN